MTIKEFKEVQSKMQAWLTNKKASGLYLKSWECPACAHANEAPAPISKRYTGSANAWTSAKQCIECGAVSFVAVPIKGDCKVYEQLTPAIIKLAV